MEKKNILMVIGVVFLVFILGTTLFYFTKQKGTKTKENQVTKPLIVDYSPESGVAGSYVILKIDDSLCSAENLKAYYDGKETKINGISGKFIRIAVPENAESGKIQVKTENIISNSVPFSVEQMEITELKSEIINPSSKTQTVNYKNEIKVNIPSGTLKEPRKLTISEVKNGPSSFLESKSQGFTFDVSLEGKEELNNYIEIGVKYDSKLLDSEKNLENQFVAVRWDETSRNWINLPIRVDVQNEILYMITDHLTGFEWAAIGGAVVVTKPLTLLGEKVLNNVYVTPQGNFKILYSKKAIEKDPILSNEWWVKKTYPDAGQIDYEAKYPKSIQDVGHLFETALRNYIDQGFKNPVVKQKWFGEGEYNKPLIVKIDSWWLKVTGEPNYEKFFQRIHIPNTRLKDKNLMKRTIGHELFHRLQAEHYGRTGFIVPSNGWWIESNAEFAGANVAWKEEVPGLNSQIGPDFLSHSLTTKGLIKGKGWGEKRFEYASAVWIRYLIENKKLNFEEMTEYVSEGNPLKKLESFIRSKGGDLMGYYRDFAAWTAFNKNSFLANYSTVTFEGDDSNDIASKKEIVSVSLEEPSLKISLKVKDGQNVFASVFKADNTEKVEANPPVLTNLSGLSNNSDVIKGLEPGDVIYILMINGNSRDKNLKIILENKGEEKASNEFHLEDDYSAKIWAVKIEGATKIEGSYTGGYVKGYSPGQESYVVPSGDGDTHEYRVEAEGGATLYIGSDCEKWWIREIEEEGSVCPVRGKSTGSFTVYRRSKYENQNWRAWEKTMEGNLTGDIVTNSNYVVETKKFYFSVEVEEGRKISSFNGKFDEASDKFFADAYLTSTFSPNAKDLVLRWAGMKVKN